MDIFDIGIMATSVILKEPRLHAPGWREPSGDFWIAKVAHSIEGKKAGGESVRLLIDPFGDFFELFVGSEMVHWGAFTYSDSLLWDDDIVRFYEHSPREDCEIVIEYDRKAKTLLVSKKEFGSIDYRELFRVARERCERELDESMKQLRESTKR